MSDENIQKLQDAINESNYIVFFGGAGVSTESGILEVRMAFIIRNINIHLKK